MNNNKILWSNQQNPSEWEDMGEVWGALLSPRQGEVYVRGGLVADVYGDYEQHTRDNMMVIIWALSRKEEEDVS